MTVLAGQRTAGFTANTNPVSASATVTISAAAGGVSRSDYLSLLPAALVSITVSPASIAGGGIATGTVNLNGPAPAGGAIVTLGSNKSTAKEAAAQLAEAEAERAALIGRIELRVVNNPATLH